MIASWRMRARSAVDLGAAAIDIAVGSLLLCIVVVTLMATANRYLLGGAFTWAEEFNLLLWVWMIQLGALRTAHVRIDAIVQRLPRRLQRTVQLVTASVCVASLMVMTWGAVRMARFVSGDFYISMPMISEQYEYWALFAVGPIWALIVVVEAMGQVRPAGTGTQGGGS